MTSQNSPHHIPREFGDRFAYAFVRTLRFFADLFFAKRYGRPGMDPHADAGHASDVRPASAEA